MCLIDASKIKTGYTSADGAFKAHHGCRLYNESCLGGELFLLDGEFSEPLASRESIIIDTGAAFCGKFVAIASHSPFWCKPFFGESLCEVPTLTAELFFHDGEAWHCILPLVKGDFKTYLEGDKDGLKIILYTNCRGEYNLKAQPCFLYFRGDNPDTLSRLAAKAASQVLGVKLREERVYPEALESLGWCSWDAMGIRVSHEGLEMKAREFKELGVPVGFAVIDDMWGDAPHLADIPDDAEYVYMCNEMHESPLRAFRPDGKRFPEGMGAAVRDIKAHGIRNVGIWFPTTGYWGGFIPGGEDAVALSDCLVKVEGKLWNNRVEETGLLLPAPTESGTGMYFSELCNRVKSWGADFVKIDNQGCHSYYEDMMPIGKSALNMQRAIDGAVNDCFSGAMINCMGMPTECMFSRPDTAVSRCSDDFIPESRAWFSKNILQCSYNGLLQGRFYTNDWDMWWTDDSSATKNSLCRAISGGPVYVSDKIGRTRPEVLKPLCYSDGRIIRADESATPTVDCMICDPTESGAPFKIKNRKGEVGILAAFNIHKSGKTVAGSVSPRDTELSYNGCAYYEYFSGKCGFISGDGKISVELSEDDIMLWSFYPGADIVPLGRIDMFMGFGAVLNPKAGEFTLAEGGEIGFVSKRAIRVWIDGEEIATERVGMLTKATCCGKNLKVEYKFK